MVGRYPLPPVKADAEMPSCGEHATLREDYSDYTLREDSFCKHSICISSVIRYSMINRYALPYSELAPQKRIYLKTGTSSKQFGGCGLRFKHHHFHDGKLILNPYGTAIWRIIHDHAVTDSILFR